jgi:glucosylceramidase
MNPPRRITSTPQRPWQPGAAPVPAGAARPGLSLGLPAGPPIAGFGGCFNELGWQALLALPEAERGRVLDLLFQPGCALGSRVCRLPMGASDYALAWHSYDEVDGDFELRHFSIERDRTHLLPYVREALARNPGLRLFASPWSPPTWLKQPKAYNYGTLRPEPEVLRTYADYFLKYVRACAAEGIAIAQVHVQNEPVADQKFPSCRWTGAQLRDFIRDHLGPLLAREAPDTEVWLGTLNGPFFDYALAGQPPDGLTQGYDQYAGLVLADPEARRHVAGVGYQWGGKHAIERTRDSWPELRLMQTESECGDGQNSWEYAHYVFNLIRHYLRHGVEAYVYWNLVLPVGGESTWGWRQNTLVSVDPGRGTWTLNPEFHLLRHVCQFLQPGARTLAMTGPWSANAMAFGNPDGSQVVVVANPGAEPRELVLRVGAATVAAAVPAQGFETLVF